MNVSSRRMLPLIVAGAALLAGAVAAHDGPHGPPPKAVAELGRADSVQWTPTTYEAATAEANLKVLASGRPAAITGEVVDVSCYLQLGKRGEAHIPCGSKCIENGQPIGILDAHDRLYIVMAEEHHPRRDGTVDLKKAFGPLLAKTVTVNGMAVEMKGYNALFVRAADLASTMKKLPAGAKK